MPYVATWMDVNIIVQGEVNQTNIIDNAYMLNLKKKKEIQMNLCTKQRHEKVALTYIYILPCVKQTTSGKLLHNTGSPA